MIVTSPVLSSTLISGFLGRTLIGSLLLSDVLSSVSSFAIKPSSVTVAETLVLFLILSRVMVTTPLVLSTEISEPSGTSHFPLSPLVAVAVFELPFGSVYFTSIFLASVSKGFGVMVILSSSTFVEIVGASGALFSMSSSFVTGVPLFWYSVFIWKEPSGFLLGTNSE